MPPIASVVTTVGQLAIPALKGLGYVGDLVARLAKTFVASFFGALGADKAFNVFDGNLDLAAAANLAAVTTVLALGKGVLARGAGRRRPALRRRRPSATRPTPRPPASGSQAAPSGRPRCGGR